MERAYDEAKYGEFSRRPYIDIVIPTLTDPSVAPPGKHIMSCFVQYAPYKLSEGTWDEQREAFGDTVIDTIAEHAPNMKKIIIGRQVITPLDIERITGLIGRATFFRANFRSNSSFSCGRLRAGRGIALPSSGCTCAGRLPIQAAELWERRDGWLRWKSLRIRVSTERGGCAEI